MYRQNPYRKFDAYRLRYYTDTASTYPSTPLKSRYNAYVWCGTAYHPNCLRTIRNLCMARCVKEPGQMILRWPSSGWSVQDWYIKCPRAAIPLLLSLYTKILLPSNSTLWISDYWGLW